jgi:hypothetical protein
MKKQLLLGILCALLLYGCRGQTGGASLSGDSTDATEETNDTREAYYEELIEALRQEILAMRTDFYIKENAYTDRIAELEERLEKAEKEEGQRPVEAEFLYSVTDGRATVTAYCGTASEVRIPAELGGCPVVGIADKAFAEQKQLLSVWIPEGVTSIGWFAFFGCIRLESITVPESVTVIGYDAFGNCNGALTIRCVGGSYAERYAVSYGIRTSRG